MQNWWTITTTASKLPTQLNYTTMRESVLAILLGTGLGFFLSVGAQNALNKHSVAVCPTKPTHQLVIITSLIGDA